jgi:hypothetical protein
MPIAPLLTTLSRGLDTLDRLLAKGAAFAREHRLEEQALLQSRLAPDMLCLARQVQILADGVRGAAARLAGLLPPADEQPAFAVFNRGADADFGPMPQGFAALHALVEAARRSLHDTVARAAAGEAPPRIAVARGGRARVFATQDFVDRYLLPNLYFHLAVVYALLRHAGVSLGKQDFEGAPAYELLPTVSLAPAER